MMGIATLGMLQASGSSAAPAGVGAINELKIKNALLSQLFDDVLKEAQQLYRIDIRHIGHWQGQKEKIIAANSSDIQPMWVEHAAKHRINDDLGVATGEISERRREIAERNYADNMERDRQSRAYAQRRMDNWD